MSAVLAEAPPIRVTAGPTDGELVAAALRGNPDAFATLVERYDRAVYHLAYRTLHDVEEARDATQEAFFKAFRTASSGGGAGKARRAAKAAKKAGGRKRRRRAVITDATRAEVKKLSEAGKTGAEIAKAVGISLPSVQNVKKALGLVKSRK